MTDLKDLTVIQPAVAVLFALVLLYIVWRWIAPRISGVGSEIEALWLALRPDFRLFAFERWTTQTLHLLFSAVVVFALVTFGWSASAGLLRALFLIHTAPSSGVGPVPNEWYSGVWGMGFLLVELVRAVGGVLLVAAAAGMAGSMIGFIFGVPRPVSDPAPAAATDAAPGSRTAEARRRAWKLSTNLTDVSDWLTKIIVGVGLVEAQTGITRFGRLTDTIALFLFDRRHGSEILIGAVMVGSAVFGFLFAYLFAQLIVSRLMEFADSQIGDAPPGGEKTLNKMDAIEESLVPRISRSRTSPDPVQVPTPDQLRAALLYSAISYDDLVARTEPSLDEVLSWSRAKAILNDYAAAARGYVYILGLKPEGDEQGPQSGRGDVRPDRLLEASRVFYAAGRQWLPLAKLVSTMAVAAITPVRSPGEAAATPIDPKIVAAIRCDAAALRLNKGLPRDPARALELLEPVDDTSSEDDGHRVFALRTMANGRLYTDARQRGVPQDQLSDYVKEVQTNLERALTGGTRPIPVSQLHHLWQAPIGATGDLEDDLFLVVAENPSVQGVITAVSKNEKFPPPPPANPSARTQPPDESPP